MSAARYPAEQITGVVLAGGRATRMGGDDKGLIEVNRRPMVEYVVERLRPQTGELLINANRNAERYAEIGRCPVIPDCRSEFAGPLAGMASAMQATETRYILTAPCDCPLLSEQLAERLFDALVEEDAQLSVAHDGQRMQPVFALLQCDLLDSMLAYLDAGERKIDAWYARHRMAHGDFAMDRDTFMNINTPQDRIELERRLAQT